MSRSVGLKFNLRLTPMAARIAGPAAGGIVAIAWATFQIWRAGLDAPAAATLVGVCAAATVIVILVWVDRALAPLRQLAHGFAFAEGRKAPADEISALAGLIAALKQQAQDLRQRLEQASFVDRVTGLPNQAWLQQWIDADLGKPRSMLLVAVFDMRGWRAAFRDLPARDAAGLYNRLAQHLQIARQRWATLSPGNRAIVARLDNDELALCIAAESLDRGEEVLQTLASELNGVIEWRGEALHAAVSGGLAQGPRDGAQGGQLLDRARLAAESAAGSSTQIKAYSPVLERQTKSRLAFERHLRSAIGKRELQAHFQPKLNLLTGRVDACEALARWTSGGARIGPDRFIPVAEAAGLIGELSELILRDACWKAAAWAREGLNVRVAVNISPLQFRRPNFEALVLEILAQSGLAPENLELEITETAVMRDPDFAARAIAPLREAGVRFALDDFGCGHSNLAALGKLPIDTIKIDRQFLAALARGESHAGPVVDMILALARTLDLDVVAEGIERRQEADFVAARGCQWAQGFLYGAASPAEEFAQLLRRRQSFGACEAA
jgi:EAL domain-containing protein (putative c-di-GMP-specific phosphodiesterase class I)/GGDEF domain-containing protein